MPGSINFCAHRVEIWHNILWSNYKGSVFSQLSNLGRKKGIAFTFNQIAETAVSRVGLGAVDLSYHQYEFKLLFKGPYEDIASTNLCRVLAIDAIKTDCHLIVLCGYHRIEYWLQLFLLRLKNKKIGVFCDSTLFDRRQSILKSAFKAVFFSQCDIVFCYGQRSKEYVRSFRVPTSKIIMGCQAAALPQGYSEDLALSMRVQAASVDPRFLYVGRLAPEKNLVRLINAFSKFASKNPSATLRIVGAGGEEQLLRATASMLGVGTRVLFLGARNQHEIAMEMAAATALVLPSLSEPWGLVVNEALLFGCPVLVSDRCGCVPELVINGQTGLTFDATDEHDMLEALDKAATGFCDKEKVARNCIELVVKFSPEAAARQILDGCIAVFRRHGACC